jgi:hypothetical protein
MTDDDFPAGTRPELEASAAEPLDGADAAILQQVADLLHEVDPVPDDLVARVQFSLALDEVFTEVARITRVPLDALAVRSDPVAGTRTETLTFSADRLTAMVTVTRDAAGRVRLDGWLAPPAELRVQLRMQEATREVASDESGRFVFDALPEGFAQLTFHLPPDEEAATPAAGAPEAEVVVTPLFQL